MEKESRVRGHFRWMVKEDKRKSQVIETPFGKVRMGYKGELEVLPETEVGYRPLTDQEHEDLAQFLKENIDSTLAPQNQQDDGGSGNGSDGLHEVPDGTQGEVAT